MSNKLLLTSDWHIRYNNPICRIDNFFETQKKVLEQVSEIAKGNNAEIIIAGDIFNKAKPENSQELEILLYDIFKDDYIYFIAGQHDLLFHKIENMDKGSIGVLRNYSNWDNNSIGFNHFNYNQEIKDNLEEDKIKICILHKYIAEKELPFFIKNGLTAKELCEN